MYAQVFVTIQRPWYIRVFIPSLGPRCMHANISPDRFRVSPKSDKRNPLGSFRVINVRTHVGNRHDPRAAFPRILYIVAASNQTISGEQTRRKGRKRTTSGSVTLDC